MATTSSVLGAILIPMHKKALLLPNVSMAELIPYRRPVPVPKSPEWHLGSLSWRGASIPLISFEGLNGEAINADSSQARIAVFNSLGTNDKLPFFGVLTQGIPRSIKITHADIGEDDKKIGPAETAAITVRGESAVIPNIDFIESAIIKANIV